MSKRRRSGRECAAEGCERRVRTAGQPWCYICRRSRDPKVREASNAWRRDYRAKMRKCPKYRARIAAENKRWRDKDRAEFEKNPRGHKSYAASIHPSCQKCDEFPATAGKGMCHSCRRRHDPKWRERQNRVQRARYPARVHLVPEGFVVGSGERAGCGRPVIAGSMDLADVTCLICLERAAGGKGRRRNGSRRPAGVGAVEASPL